MAKRFTTSTVTKLRDPVQRHVPCQCASLQSFSPRTFTTSPVSHGEQEDSSNLYSNRGRELREGPRWASTPPRMMAPVRSKPPVLNNDFAVNTDPIKLDRVYNRLLGRGGDRMLSDEVKWLAVTHKSFDHGRRGYNDRLAMLGKRIVELQTSLALINASSSTENFPTRDEFGREPFQHSSLQGLTGLSERIKSERTGKKKFTALASSYGLESVVRWKPKRMTNLEGSGLPAIVGQALYAIVGAISLQRGGQVANDVVRERILNPLGLR